VRTPYLVAAILVGGTFLSHLQFARMLLSESATKCRFDMYDSPPVP